jgi:DUF2946 family protein
VEGVPHLCYKSAVTILRLRRTAAWLALAAMALNAAWPLLANAQPANPAAEICSAAGGNHASGGAPATPGKGYHASHCNLCPFGAERGAAVSHAMQPRLPAAPVLAQAFKRYDAPRPDTATHPTARPRAPPSFS